MPTPISDQAVPWPDAAVRKYIAKGYWTGLAIGEIFAETATLHEVDLALIDSASNIRLNYAELSDRTDAAAARLLELGLSRGDRIVVQLANGWEFVILTLACLRAGIVPVMALPAHRHAEIFHIACRAEATGIAVPDWLGDFDHQALAHQLAGEVSALTGGPWHVLVAGTNVGSDSIDLRALCGPGVDRPSAAQPARFDSLSITGRDVAVFLLSGGTTGLPKLIARTHDDYAYNARRSAEIAHVDANSVYLVSLPAGHNFALGCPGVLGTLLAGGTVVILPSPEPARAFRTIATEQVTHTAVVPAVAQRWLDHAMDHGSDSLASLQVLQVGGARLATELARRVGPVLGCTLQQVFGMAEGLVNLTRLDDPDDVICTTQGRPMCADDEVRLVDELDRDVPVGQPGSLLTRGPYTPRGYYNAAEHNSRSFTPDGWYRTGDICRRTAQGNLIVDGRDDDLINRGGEKISAEEVENLVYRIPAVAQVAAVAMPDRELGERVCVYVVPRAHRSVSLDEIRTAMQVAGAARFKIPERLEIVAELPATKVGKINKKALRADIATRLAHDSPVRS